MGFVNLPIEGDPVARLPEVLDQIQAALAEDHATNVRRMGNRIEFSTGSFLRRWFFRGRFLVSSGEIEAEASSDSLMIDYRLSFFELLVATTLAVLSSVVALAFRGGIASLRSNLYVLLFAYVLIFGVTIVRAASKFSRFLRKFPREAGSTR
jgi:cytochrome c biogenesis protein CcdA